MDLSSTLKSQRPHIAFFGCTNVGKSSLVNAITNQNLSVVSSIKGTTTDPVIKTMEILPLGPVVIIDTAGIDDNTKLGHLRIEKTNQIIRMADLSIIVLDALEDINNSVKELISTLEKQNKKYLIVRNKADLLSEKDINNSKEIYVSAITSFGIENLKNKIAQILNSNINDKSIIKNKITKADIILLVIPIDESAPKGRLILPQQNTLREILDSHASAICCQVEEVETMLKIVTPTLVITDSQVFEKVKDIIPENILLTSFSILMANYKGELKTFIQATRKLDNLQDGSIVLISEGCTHHRQCNDIGSVKLPNWIKNYTKKDITFEFTQGGEFPTDLKKYDLIVHCGGCMLNEQEMKSRIFEAKENNVDIINYGILIAYINGILNRAIEIFPEIKEN